MRTVTKPGVYQLARAVTVLTGPFSCEKLQRGDEILVTLVDHDSKKFLSPAIGLWAPWQFPAKYLGPLPTTPGTVSRMLADLEGMKP